MLGHHSKRPPGFAGTLEFRIAFELLGKRVGRQARVEYTCSPQWEYYDLKAKALVVGTGYVTMGLYVKAERDAQPKKADGRRKMKPARRKAVWERIDISAFGVLPNEVWRLLHDRIEDRCMAEDALRRQRVAAGKKVLGEPPQKVRFDAPPDVVRFDER